MPAKIPLEPGQLPLCMVCHREITRIARFDDTSTGTITFTMWCHGEREQQTLNLGAPLSSLGALSIGQAFRSAPFVSPF